MDFTDDKHLDVCQNIEAGLKHQYDIDPGLTDSKCIVALDNAKIAVKHRFGYAKNESVSSAPELRGVIAWCVSIGEARIEKVNDLTLKEYVARLEKIRRSVVFHADAGSRSYYAFIKHFLP